MASRGCDVQDRATYPVGATKLDRTVDHRTTTDGYADFAVVYDTHKTAIYRYVRRLVANEADAEDLTVTAFEKALKAWERRPPEGEMRPWLFRIATNACLDELRRRQRVQWQPWNRFVNLFHPNQVAPDNPEEETLRREKAGVVRAALSRLAPRDRAALILREYQGLSVDDVGRALGISRGAAKITLFRARERLRAAYVQLGGELPRDYWTTNARSVDGPESNADGEWPAHRTSPTNDLTETSDPHE